MCSGELTFKDLDTGESLTLRDVALSITENNITFTGQLRLNRHYNATVRAANVNGAAMSCISISEYNTLIFFLYCYCYVEMYSYS